MGRITADSDWVAQMHCLTVHPEHDAATDQIGESQRRIAVLRRAAQAVAADDDPRTRQAFNAIPRGTQARVLAETLAVSLPGAGDHPVTCPHSGLELVLAYLQALREASTAVYFCRRIQHATGTCWFSVHGPEADLCGRVLAVAHRLGDSGRAAGTLASRREDDLRRAQVREDHTGTPR